MDVVRAIVGLAQSVEASGKVYNIGSQEEISIMDLAKTIKKKTQSHSKIITIPYAQAYDDGFEDMQYRNPSIEKIKTTIGWNPKYKLEDILDSIIIYQEKNRTKFPVYNA